MREEEVRAIASGIFEQAPATVIEAYSEPGAELRTFPTTDSLATYFESRRGSPGGSAHVGVHFTDMAGAVLRTRITLVPGAADGADHRFKAEGWGLIWLHLDVIGSRIGSRVSANTEKRAHRWAGTYPELGSPADWNWPAVQRHLRRLRRLLDA